MMDWALEGQGRHISRTINRKSTDIAVRIGFTLGKDYLNGFRKSTPSAHTNSLRPHGVAGPQPEREGLPPLRLLIPFMISVT
jgi:hypothetical protein